MCNYLFLLFITLFVDTHMQEKNIGNLIVPIFYGPIRNHRTILLIEIDCRRNYPPPPLLPALWPTKQSESERVYQVTSNLKFFNTLMLKQFQSKVCGQIQVCVEYHRGVGHSRPTNQLRNIPQFKNKLNFYILY